MSHQMHHSEWAFTVTYTLTLPVTCDPPRDTTYSILPSMPSVSESASCMQLLHNWVVS